MPTPFAREAEKPASAKTRPGFGCQTGYRAQATSLNGSECVFSFSEAHLLLPCRLHAEALALRRELREKGTVAETLVALGRLEGARGEKESGDLSRRSACACARDEGCWSGDKQSRSL